MQRYKKNQPAFVALPVIMALALAIIVLSGYIYVSRLNNQPPSNVSVNSNRLGSGVVSSDQGTVSHMAETSGGKNGGETNQLPSRLLGLELTVEREKPYVEQVRKYFLDEKKITDSTKFRAGVYGGAFSGQPAGCSATSTPFGSSSGTKTCWPSTQKARAYYLYAYYPVTSQQTASTTYEYYSRVDLDISSKKITESKASTCTFKNIRDEQMAKKVLQAKAGSDVEDPVLMAPWMLLPTDVCAWFASAHSSGNWVVQDNGIPQRPDALNPSPLNPSASNKTQKENHRFDQ